MILVSHGSVWVRQIDGGQDPGRELGWTFVEADDFHPAANIEKMRRGIPLEDADRRPWLDAIRQRLMEADRGENIVLACSALKHAYRHYLARCAPSRSTMFTWSVRRN